jgi:hypothetical protein
MSGPRCGSEDDLWSFTRSSTDAVLGVNRYQLTVGTGSWEKIQELLMSLAVPKYWTLEIRADRMSTRSSS